MKQYEITARKIRGKNKIDYVDDVSLDTVINECFPMVLEGTNKEKIKWHVMDIVDCKYNKAISNHLVIEVSNMN